MGEYVMVFNGDRMHQRPADLPPAIETPDAVIHRLPEFGEFEGSGVDLVRGELGPGADTTPLLEGLEDDLCQVPHWGYVVDGRITVRYTDGTEEVNEAGEAIHWPPGHTIYTEDESATLILFSPRDEHGHLFEHIEQKMEQMRQD
jgi:hypothetical protein